MKTGVTLIRARDGGEARERGTACGGEQWLAPFRAVESLAPARCRIELLCDQATITVPDIGDNRVSAPAEYPHHGRDRLPGHFHVHLARA